MKRSHVIIVVGGILFLFFTGWVVYEELQVACLHRMKQSLVLLANNQAEIQRRVDYIKKHRTEQWTDLTVGITSDGYVFCYGLHDSHGEDLIRDVNILYLPDEKRFIVNRNHFCCDLNKAEQPRNKADLIRLFERWRN